MIAVIDIHPGRYYDSVRLMQVSRDVSAVPGVSQAMVAMATELNQRVLADMGFDPSQIAATPDDLLIAIQAADDAAIAAARAAADVGLEPGRTPGSATIFVPPPPRTAASAGRAVSANLALISVPGRHAFVEAMDALRHGMHVMVFSNNVPVEQEVVMKAEAATRGLLVMGPDCGTAIVAGVGLGFANAIDPGPVGIAGASGTGIQQICCLLDAAGVGIRHALGTGSRDLSAAVGGASTVQALRALERDPAVELIMVVSKPPDRDVRAVVAGVAAECTKPVVTALLGEPGTTLEGAARAAVAGVGGSWPELPTWRPDRTTLSRGGALRGFFSGGTLRDEAASVIASELDSVATDPGAPGHRLVDYGADEFTEGRAHPMIDPELRMGAIAAAIDDPTTAVILMDLVLGYGAHPDPAGLLAPAAADAVASGIPVVVSLCGTRRDPQDRDRQAATLHAAGAEVHLSNATAASRAAALVTGAGR